MSENLKTELNDEKYSGKEIAEIVEILNEKNIDEVSPTVIFDTTIIDAFEDPRDGDALLVALETAANVNGGDTLLQRSLKWLETKGLDVGNSSTRAMIDQLQAVGVFTQVQTDTLKNLAVKKVSRAQQLGFSEVKYRDIQSLKGSKQ